MKNAIEALWELIRLEDLGAREAGLRLWAERWTATYAVAVRTSRYLSDPDEGARLYMEAVRANARLDVGKAIAERCVEELLTGWPDSKTDTRVFAATTLLPTPMAPSKPER